jgi:hypothetical protein
MVLNGKINDGVRHIFFGADSSGLRKKDGLNATREYRPQPTTSDLRVDIALRDVDTTTCFDVAVHNPVWSSYPGSPGGAALRYEKGKNAKYQPLMTDSSVFIPLVAETGFCWSPSALTALRSIAQSYSARFELGPQGIQRAMAIMLQPLYTGVAKILLGASATEAGALDIELSHTDPTEYAQNDHAAPQQVNQQC